MGKSIEFKVIGEKIVGNGLEIQNLAIFIDNDGVLLKYGEANKVKAYEVVFRTGLSKLGELNKKYEFSFIDFSNRILSKKEQCVILNWIVNCSALGEELINLKNMSEIELKNKVKYLKSIGF